MVTTLDADDHEALQSAVAEWMDRGKHQSVDKADKTIALDNYAATPVLFQGVKK